MGSVLIDGYKYSALNYVYAHVSEQFHDDQFEFARHYRHTHDGQLPPDLFWEYVTYKHDLDPHRFDHYHHIICKWIEEVPHHGRQTHSPPPATTSSTSFPPGHTSVDEPASWVLFMAAVILGCTLTIIRRRKKTVSGGASPGADHCPPDRHGDRREPHPASDVQRGVRSGHIAVRHRCCERSSVRSGPGRAELEPNAGMSSVVDSWRVSIV